MKQLSFAILLCLIGSGVSMSATPQLINYQAFLTDSGPGNNPVNGTFDITFTIYDNSTGGNIIWTETQTGVVVEVGNFSVLLVYVFKASGQVVLKSKP